MKQTLEESTSIPEYFPEQLLDSASQLHVTSGTTLFHFGERPHWMFCVLSGEVRLVRRAHDGVEVVLQRSRGRFFAEASLCAKSYHCDGVIAKSGAVLRFPIKAFHTALQKDLHFNDAWINHLAHETRKLRAQCERLSLHSAADRIIHYIESEGVDGILTLTQSRKAWAAEIGLSHESLYRTLSRLQSENVIVVEQQRIALK